MEMEFKKLFPSFLPSFIFFPSYFFLFHAHWEGKEPLKNLEPRMLWKFLNSVIGRTIFHVTDWERMQCVYQIERENEHNLESTQKEFK